MTYVVTESCIKCKYTDCVDVCPVDCFHEGPNMLVIDPDECIDCTLCVAECPVEAIFAEEDVPEDQRSFTKISRACEGLARTHRKRKTRPPTPTTGKRSRTRLICWSAAERASLRPSVNRKGRQGRQEKPNARIRQ